MPSYDVAAVAEALDIEPRQLDNMLSRNDLPGVLRKARGVARLLSPEVVVTIHLAWDLARSLEMPIATALQVARQIEASSPQAVALGAFARLSADVQALRAATLSRLDSAVETVGRRRRGRRPQTTTRSTAT